MTPLFDAASSGGCTSGTNITFAHTTSGTHNYALAVLCWYDPLGYTGTAGDPYLGDLLDSDYDGQSLFTIHNTGDPSFPQSIAYFANTTNLFYAVTELIPSTGTHNVVYNFVNPVDAMAIFMSFTNHQVTVDSNWQAVEGFTDHITKDSTSDTTDLIASFGFSLGGAPFAVDAGQTQRINDTSSWPILGISSTAPAASPDTLCGFTKANGIDDFIMIQGVLLPFVTVSGSQPHIWIST